MNVKPIYELNETYYSRLGIQQAIDALSAHMRQAGYKPEVLNSALVVKVGSDMLVRLFGTMLPWGRTSVPVGMTVTFTPEAEGSKVSAHAYDRLGWYLDAKTNKTFEQESEKKIGALIGHVRKVFGG